MAPRAKAGTSSALRRRGSAIRNNASAQTASAGGSLASLARTILEEHLARGELTPGTEIALRVDQTLAQDATGTMAMMQFEGFGHDRIQVETAVVYVDHNILQIDFKNPDDHRFLQAMSAKYGAWFSRPGNGICHYVHCERFAAPGKTLVGADSHTTQSGSCAMIAIGAGGLDVAVCMAGHPFELPCPQIVGVHLENELNRPWIQAKDVILELLRRRGVRGGRGSIFEFFGPGVATLSYTERGTIANMIAELGATGAVFPSDEQTRLWLEEQGRGDNFIELETGGQGDFEEEEEIDLAALVPLVARPSSPGNVVPVEEIAGTELAQVCIGSSVNSSYEDLAVCGAALRGQRISDRLVSATATPGSRQILDQITRSGTYVDLLTAGVRMLEPACGPCVGMGQAPPSGSASLRTFNRNFPGRSGTADDQVYLCSPAVAAASMLSGAISDPRELSPVELPERPPARSEVVQKHILAPASEEEAAGIEIPRGPNIKPPPEQRELPDDLELRVLIVAPDDISTGDLSPDGATVMAYRSNVPAIAEFTFQHRDKEFPRRAREWGGGFIVAGHNYGQGSSREHAALAPAQLGVRAVIAKSFARIHRRNLIAQGVVPLLFKNEVDHDRAELGQSWRISGLQSIGQGADELETEIDGGETITLTHDLLPREREIVVAGGLIRYLREHQPAPA
ncbi:MAG: aconitate hydratase [Actinobacteria bacterium]|nr:aconitate hydratase [Actinomycetota bacterium]